jgi:hypothetical protein
MVLFFSRITGTVSIPAVSTLFLALQITVLVCGGYFVSPSFMHCISECGVLERNKHIGYFKVDSSENYFMFFCYMHCFFGDDTLQYSVLVPLFMVTYQINTINS